MKPPPEEKGEESKLNPKYWISVTPALVGNTRQKTLILLKRKFASESGSSWSSEYLVLLFRYLARSGFEATLANP